MIHYTLYKNGEKNEIKIDKTKKKTSFGCGNVNSNMPLSYNKRIQVKIQLYMY